MRNFFIGGLVAFSFLTQSATACEIYQSKITEEVKANDKGDLTVVTLAEVHIDAQDLEFNKMKSQAKMLAISTVLNFDAAQVEIYFYDGKPRPHSIEAEMQGYFVYTPDPSRLTFRNSVWTGEDLSDVEPDFPCSVAPH